MVIFFSELLLYHAHDDNKRVKFIVETSHG